MVAAPSENLRLLQLSAAFGLGAAAAVALQKYYATYVAKEKAGGVAKSGTEAMEEELLQEQLSRIRSFFGENGFAKVENSFVVVVGMGGVGSHAAHMLARSGVRKLRLIDFDNVTLSSLNRHALGTRADVGLPKTTVMKKKLQEIVPHCEIEDCAVMFTEDAADVLLEGNPDYVLDCIDDVTTKTALLAAVSAKGLPAITATGAGAKADPTKLQIGTLNDAVRDPLATKMRYFLKKRELDFSKLSCVFSSERSTRKLLPLNSEQTHDPHEFGTVDHFRVRVIPVLGTTPALFGNAMAAFVLCELAGQPMTPDPVGRLSRDQRNKLYQSLQQRELKLGQEKSLPLDRDDLEFVFQHVWRGKSAVSFARQEGRERLLMCRWRNDRPLRPDNVVYITSRELERLEELGHEEAFGRQVVDRIDARLKEFEGWE